MKKILTLTIITMLIAVSASAQLRPRRDMFEHKHQTFKPQHEFRLGIGAYPLNGSNYFENYDIKQGGLKKRYNDALFANESTYTTGAISIGYSYRAKRWLEFGVTATLASQYHSVLRRETREVVNKVRRNSYAITPMVRFSWLNRDIVRLYSQVAAGLQIDDIRGRSLDYYNHDRLLFVGQITYIGISLGRKLFVYSELGTGTQGAFIIGGGYRFGEKKT